MIAAADPARTNRIPGISRTVDEAKEPARSRMSAAAVRDLEDFGLIAVGYDSEDTEIEKWEAALWEDQRDRVAPLEREWRMNLHYCAGRQFLAWHRTLNTFVLRNPSGPEERSRYNITEKAVGIRVTRLTENKPTVTLQSATTDRADYERVQYKEQVFWSLWRGLGIHAKIVRARRWATKCSSGFIKVGWDPDGGRELPATKFFPRVKVVEKPVPDPMAPGGFALGPDGQPITQPVEVFDGLEECYVDKDRAEIGPVHVLEADPEREGQYRWVRQPIPPTCATYFEGQVSLGVRSPFNIRYDWSAEEIHESTWVQDAEVLPLTQILGRLPREKLEKLKQAKEATSAENPFPPLEDVMPEAGIIDNEDGLSGGRGRVDKGYLWRETWIFPKDRHTRERWGNGGALLITVGGKLVHKSPLPKWALEACPFVQFIDTPEEGNHYGKTFLRDFRPLQDSINKSRFHMAEDVAIRSRLMLGVPENATLRPTVLPDLPVTILTHKPMMRPEPIDLGRGMGEAAKGYYNDTLSAAMDLASMNDASTGKLPSAGIAAKAVYALQFADRQSINEASALQDESLASLAKAMDAVTRVEYTYARKVRIPGEDREFLVEHEVKPEHLSVEVDYYFAPGSMLSHQKEAVKNEVLALQQAGIITPQEARRLVPTSTPDAFRSSYDLQEAHARRLLNRIRKEPVPPEGWQPKPYQDPAVHADILREFMLTRAFEMESEERQAAILNLWNAYQLALQPPPAPVEPGADPGAAPAGAPPEGQQIGGMQPYQPEAGALELEQRATEAMEGQHAMM